MCVFYVNILNIWQHFSWPICECNRINKQTDQNRNDGFIDIDIQRDGVFLSKSVNRINLKFKNETKSWENT